MLPNDPVFRFMNYHVRVFVKRYYHLRVFFKMFALALFSPDWTPLSGYNGSTPPPPGIVAAGELSPIVTIGEQTSGNDESLNQYENRLGQLGICPYIYVLWTKTSGWGTKPFCWKMKGYENCFYVQDGDMKFSSILRSYPPPWYPRSGMTAPLVFAVSRHRGKGIMLQIHVV